MLFRPPQRVYTVLQVGILAVLAGVSGFVTGQDNIVRPRAEGSVLESNNGNTASKDKNAAPVPTATAKDVLGREISVPADWDTKRRYPVVYIFDQLPAIAYWQWAADRRREFFSAREIEMKALVEQARPDSDDAAKRLEAFAYAMQHWIDPGPALAAGVSHTFENGEPVSPADLSFVGSSFGRLDSNSDGSLVDEIDDRRGFPVALKLKSLEGMRGGAQSDALAEAIRLQRHRAIGFICGGCNIGGKGLTPTEIAERNEWHDRIVPSGHWLIDLPYRAWDVESPPRIPREPVDTSSINGSSPLAEVKGLYLQLVEIDGVDRKSKLLEIADAARSTHDSIVTIGRREDLSGEQIEKLWEIGADASYRLGRALGYMELPDVDTDSLIRDRQAHDEEFERAWFQIEGFGFRLDSPRFALLSVRAYRRAGKLGAALRLVQTLSETVEQGSPQDFWYSKKRRDLYRDLGWDAWEEYEQHWMWRRFPQWTYALEFGVE